MSIARFALVAMKLFLRRYAMKIAQYALALAALGSVAQAAERALWQPSGKWVVRFEKDQCIAMRSFARGEQKVTLGIQPTPLSEWNRVLFETPGSPQGLGLDRGSLVVGGDRQPTRSALVGPSTKTGFQIIDFGASDEELKGLTNDPQLQFTAAGKTVTLPVTSFASVKRLLDDCEARLLESWGFSIADQARVVTYPDAGKGLRNAFTSEDYPRTALRRNAVGQVDIRAMIGTDGKPRDCVVVRSSGHPDLDAVTCNLFMQRSTFSPAVGIDQRPMAAPVFLTLRWLL